MTMSVSDFQKQLESQVRAVCTEFGTKFDSAAERGWAFQLWCARLFADHITNIDTDPEDAVLKIKDLGVDVVLEDQDNQQLYLMQCKYTGSNRKAKQNPASESEILQFATVHSNLLDREWVRSHASVAAHDLLGNYVDYINNGWTPNYYFITTGAIDSRAEVAFSNALSPKEAQEASATGTLFDLSGLKAFYIRTLSIDDDLPDEIKVDIPQDFFFVKSKPRKTLIASVKGSWLKHLYNQHKESLFSWNIRGYMGNRGLNNEIARTAEASPEDFFYYNNGVSAICKSFDIQGNHLTVNKIQIINGAQTVGSLSKSTVNEGVDVLFRLTETNDVNIEKGINSQIIRYNNTQNVIKISDFRSNDEIQKWLERQFKEVRNFESLQSVSYLRKRGKKAGAAKALKLEDLAKIIYCFNHSPTRIYSTPRDLWTLSSYGGVYEMVFGANGKLPLEWTTEKFHESLLALAISQRLDVSVQQEKRAGRTFMHRLRFHLLSLIGLGFRSEDRAQYGTIVKNKNRFDPLWSKYWDEARRALIQDYTTHCEEEEDGMTLHAYMRSELRWRKLCKIYKRNLQLPESLESADARESTDG